MMNLFKKEKKVTVDSALEVKGWSDSFLAPLVLYVPDLEISHRGEKAIEAMITHCVITPGTALEDLIIKEVKQRYNLSDADLLKYSGACCFDYAIIVNRRFKKLCNKQKLVLLLLEAYRAEGFHTIPIKCGFSNTEDIDRADALVHVTDLFGKMAVSGALKKQRKVFDQSCYRASSHKLFQKAPKEKIYTDRFLSQVEQNIAEEQEASEDTEQPTPQPEQAAPETAQPEQPQQQTQNNNNSSSSNSKSKGKGAA